MGISMRCRWALPALLASVLLAPVANAQDMPALAVQARIVEVLEREALYRNKVDWQAIRTRLQSANADPAQTWQQVRDAIAVSSGGTGGGCRRRTRCCSPLRAAAASLQLRHRLQLSARTSPAPCSNARLSSATWIRSAAASAG